MESEQTKEIDNDEKPNEIEDNTNETTALTTTIDDKPVINTNDVNNDGVDSLNGVVWKLYISRLLTALGDR